MNRACISLSALSAISVILCVSPALAQMPNTAAEAFLMQVETHFAAWDANQDGILSSKEADTVVSNPKVSGQEAAAIASLKRALRSKTYHLPALTVAAIRERTGTTLAKDQPDFAKFYETAASRLPKQNVLFGSSLPQIQGVKQGKLGDCYCLAALAAMTMRNPQDVANLFTLLPSGNYQVRLGKKRITVKPPTDAEIVMSASTTDNGMWINLYEKAVGVTRRNSKSTAALDAVTGGGSSGKMLSILTGNPVSRFSCSFARSKRATRSERTEKMASLRKQLSAAVAEKRLAVCTTSKGASKPTTPGITPYHAYAVFGYDAATDRIRLWNPHGDNFIPQGEIGLKNGYPRTNGVFEMPLPDFVDQFVSISFEKIPLSGAVKDSDASEAK